MKKIRFALIGSGWRSLFYIRIAKALSEYFEITAIRVRSKEKQDFILSSYGFKSVLNDQAVVDTNPDFVVVAVSKSELFKVSRYYLEKGIAVLCETPGAGSKEELIKAYSYTPSALYGIAEQYFLYPRYSSIIKLIKDGIIGKPYYVYLSLCHDYHALSLIRKFLLEEGHPKLLFEQTFEEELLGGFSRYESDISDDLVKDSRVVRLFSFSSGKDALYDFSSSIYHSPLRDKHFRVEGEKGFIDERGVVSKSLKAPFTIEYRILDRSDVDKMQRRVEVVDKISVGDRVLFKNRFPDKILSEDEYAITLLLFNFYKAINGEEELLYPAREAILDSLL